jgi:hypothetical protein
MIKRFILLHRYLIAIISEVLTEICTDMKSSENPLKTMVSPRTKIDNLFLTGQSVNMHGILGCTIGAFNTCAEILGKELIDERLTQMINKNKVKIAKMICRLLSFGTK